MQIIHKITRFSAQSSSLCVTFDLQSEPFNLHEGPRGDTPMPTRVSNLFGPVSYFESCINMIVKLRTYTAGSGYSLARKYFDMTFYPDNYYYYAACLLTVNE